MTILTIHTNAYSLPAFAFYIVAYSHLLRGKTLGLSNHDGLASVLGLNEH